MSQVTTPAVSLGITGKAPVVGREVLQSRLSAQQLRDILTPGLNRIVNVTYDGSNGQASSGPRTLTQFTVEPSESGLNIVQLYFSNKPAGQTDQLFLHQRNDNVVPKQEANSRVAGRISNFEVL